MALPKAIWQELLERLQINGVAERWAPALPPSKGITTHTGRRTWVVSFLFGSNFFEGQSESVRVTDNYSDMAVRDMDEISPA